MATPKPASPKERGTEVHNCVAGENWRKELFHTVYSEISLQLAKNVSIEEREQMERNGYVCDWSLLYGEIEFSALETAFVIIRERGGGLKGEEGSTFVDLGSGSGKAVVAAALLHNFNNCVGLEILKNLHDLAMSASMKWEQLKLSSPALSKMTSNLHFIHGDMLEYDLSNAHVVLANSTGYDENLMSKLSKCTEKMEPGSFFISFSQCLPSPAFKVIGSARCKQSWGIATLFIHKRLPKREALMNKLARRASSNHRF
jgi:hypothetical protein